MNSNKSRNYYISNSISQIIIWGFILNSKDTPKWSITFLILGIFLSLSCLVLKNKTLLLTSISQMLLLIFIAVTIVTASHTMAKLGSLIIFTMVYSFLCTDLINAGFLKLKKPFKKKS